MFGESSYRRLGLLLEELLKVVFVFRVESDMCSDLRKGGGKRVGKWVLKRGIG